MKHTSHIRGFTLIELAVVLIIISLLVGGGLAIAIAQLDVMAEKETRTKLAAIEDAINGYIKLTAKRLPCPANPALVPSGASFGREWGTPGDGNCTGSASAPSASSSGKAGMVPTRTLNLPDEYACDGWGNKFTYVVDKRMTTTNAFTTYTLSSSAVGDMIVYDYASGVTYRTNQAVLIIISHGKNGYGSFSCNGTTPSSSPATADRKNTWSNATTLWNVANGSNFIAKDFYDGVTTSEIFDDILVIKRRHQLRTHDE